MKTLGEPSRTGSVRLILMETADDRRAAIGRCGTRPTSARSGSMCHEIAIGTSPKPVPPIPSR